LIAAGTGFAQMQSILHEVFARGIRNPVYLYRGARKTANLYPSELIEDWLNAHDNFHYIPIISEMGEDCHWRGREGLLHDAVCEDFDHFNGARVFISGSPAMVYATLDVLVAHGINEDQVQSDTFTYAPR
jgi:CDP-4-dehydro-6-deoxyglucose reductase